ncbi:hypothetical protein FG379_001706 [Cryptosporidium bovis]|uniref:uncharacterized protein n=1 Tax=Cryptosporidium bovis TaxID=310047 RepID=UPI00351A3E38|nr:hypothetical protein FG379_001706 [Cryptosporidium bovis]
MYIFHYNSTLTLFILTTPSGVGGSQYLARGNKGSIEGNNGSSQTASLTLSAVGTEDKRMFPITFKQYVTLSFVLLIGLFMHLLNVYDYNFFHIIMHITVTKASTIVITNAGFITMFYCGKLVLNIFIGRLRDIEIEEIIDQGRMFLLDTIFFLLFSSPTINNVEVGAMVLSRYITLVLLLKMLHLIIHIRINHMFEVERPRVFNVIRVALLLNILLVIDLSLIFRYLGLLSRESTLRLWIFFESISLFVSCVISTGKYIVHVIDLKIQALQLNMRKLEEDTNYQYNGDSTNSSHNFVWSNKNAVLFYMEVIGDICSLVSYLLFIILFLLLNPSRIPLYIMGDILHIIKALYNKLSSFRRYRKLTKNMETKFQEATLEEIERVDTCIVCRDTLYIGSKKIPCGHVFHLDCLKSWFIQQQTCPICRSPINIQDDVQEIGVSVRNEREEENNANFEENSNNASEVSDRIYHNNPLNNNNLQNSDTGDKIEQMNINKDENQSSSETNIKILRGILKGFVISETKNVHSISNTDNELGTKKYKPSTHPLLKRNNFHSPPKNSIKKNDFDPCSSNLTQTPPIRPQDLLKINQEIPECHTFSDKFNFGPAPEVYRKNADIWLCRISELINSQQHIGDATSYNIGLRIEEEKGSYIKGNSHIPEVEEGHEMKNSFDDLFNTVKWQLRYPD